MMSLAGRFGARRIGRGSAAGGEKSGGRRALLFGARDRLRGKARLKAAAGAETTGAGGEKFLTKPKASSRRVFEHFPALESWTRGRRREE
ncbi:Hypothetical predicted protein [Podarcis lilfordi]|uniref:Uncharacterized protein n=1 Tax=Podarcis lilfordi TaxID=74358 RepID=A0AA35PLD9_9SAUR|nr:Hypothetical predicted protein [Podarcis lilfordi]